MSLSSVTEPVQLYTCEAMTGNRHSEKHLMATETWFVRSMQTLKWTEVHRGSGM